VDWLRDVELFTHPFPETLLERCWKVTGAPPPDWFVDQADWVYAPAELRLPFRSARTAVTIHDVQALETDLPWSNTPEHQRFRKKWLHWLPTMIEEATKVLTVSEFSKRRMVELLGAPAEKIVVVGNGVADEFYAAGSEGVACDLEPPRVLVVGGLRTKKGAAATLSLAQELARRKSPLQIEIFGQHEEDWMDRAKALQNVQLSPFLPDTEIANRLARSVALLFLSPYEGFGLPALEAMAAGTPAVVANCASLPEVVGKAGICVEPNEPEFVADTLERLRWDQGWRDSVVRAGKTHAAHHTWDRCVALLTSMFHSRV
jgi:glycosyltransferase involved in cell wall biosynthesis